MKEEYFISIKSKQYFENDNTTINLETVGNYLKKGNYRYIIYKEYHDDEPRRYSNSILKIYDEKYVTLTKCGDNKTKLILERGKRHHCFYQTEIGNMMIGVFTDKITSNFSDDGGEINISYSLDVNANLASINDINITVRKMN